MLHHITGMALLFISKMRLLETQKIIILILSLRLLMYKTVYYHKETVVSDDLL